MKQLYLLKKKKSFFGKIKSFFGRKMTVGYIIISLDSLIKRDDISICLPATRTEIEEEAAWHVPNAQKHVLVDEKACVCKAWRGRH